MRLFASAIIAAGTAAVPSNRCTYADDVLMIASVARCESVGPTAACHTIHCMPACSTLIARAPHICFQPTASIS